MLNGLEQDLQKRDLTVLYSGQCADQADEQIGRPVLMSGQREHELPVEPELRDDSFAAIRLMPRFG
jgi:hypothetical protein